MYSQKINHSRPRKKTVLIKVPLLLLMMMLVLSILCIFVYDCLIAMPYFQTKDIHVSGNKFLSKTHILECTHLTPSENIIDINISKIHQQLMQEPWIASAHVFRTFPNLLTIEINEKMPLATLLFQEPLIIDTQGRVIKKQASSDPQNLPVVTGISYADLSPNNAPLSQKMILIIRVLTEKKQVLGLPQNMNISHVHIDTHFGITVWLNQAENEMEILLGTDNFQKKFYRLRKILTFFQYQNKHKQIEYIDINSLDRIIVRPLENHNSDGKEV
jgi:cell division protein FtsQ